MSESALSHNFSELHLSEVSNNEPETQIIAPTNRQLASVSFFHPIRCQIETGWTADQLEALCAHLPQLYFLLQTKPFEPIDRYFIRLGINSLLIQPPTRIVTETGTPFFGDIIGGVAEQLYVVDSEHKVGLSIGPNDLVFSYPHHQPTAHDSHFKRLLHSPPRPPHADGTVFIPDEDLGR